MNTTDIAKELREMAERWNYAERRRTLLAAADIVERFACMEKALLASRADRDTIAAENAELKEWVQAFELRHAAVMLHTQGVVDENARLIEDIGKCHDVLGESRDSDTSELWKAFEVHKTLIARVRRLEDENARLKIELKEDL